MRITPIDIRQQQFTLKLFRGFDVQEVDTFLEDVANDYEQLLKENALLKEQLMDLEERARGTAEREKVLQETLVTTQRMVEEWKENARREAQLLARPSGRGHQPRRVPWAARTSDAPRGAMRSNIPTPSRTRSHSIRKYASVSGSTRTVHPGPLATAPSLR